MNDSETELVKRASLKCFDRFLEFLEGKGYGEYKRSKLRENFLEYLIQE